jgi:hypothetical protein
MKRNRNIKFILAGFYIFIFSFLLCNSLGRLDPDFGWHLKSGESVYNEHRVPSEENYDYTLQGRTWVDHEWLPNLLSYLVYTNFGYVVLNIIFAIIGVLFFFLLNSFLLKDHIESKMHLFLIMLLEIFGLLGVRYHFGVRMQEISAVLFLVELGILDRISRSSSAKYLWSIPILFFVWANLHAGFMFGLIILWMFWAVNLCVPLLKKILKKLPFDLVLKGKGEIWNIFLWSLVSTLAVLATPYHVRYFTFMFEYTNTFYLSHISEWLPLWQYPISYIHLFFCAAIVTAIIIYFFDHKEKRTSVWNFILVAVLFVAAFKARRNFPLFFAASMPFWAVVFSSRKDQPEKKIDGFYLDKFILPFLSVCMIVASILLLIEARYTNNPFSDKKNCEFYPCGALETIKKLPDQRSLKILNDYNWGGFLIWMWPGHKLFIDGRLPMLTVNDHSLMQEYYDFTDPTKTKEKLDSYGINLILKKKLQDYKFNWFEKTFFGLQEKHQKDVLGDYIKENGDWSLKYEDKFSTVYFKNNYGSKY